MTIGSRIAQARKDKGFTQEYVAEKLGVSRQAVSKWETDLTSPDTKNLMALADLLDLSVEFLATGKEPDSPTRADSPFGLAHGLRIGSLICLIVMVICWFTGLVSGVYTDMVQIPLSSGLRLGIPLLMYGETPLAIGLVIVSVICFILMIILLFVANYADKHKK